MAEARRAINECGVTEVAMARIQAALARLAREPGLMEGFTFQPLHGGGASVALMDSEGDEGLTLTLARFDPGVPTPIHDHGSWAVIHVVEGRDRYTQWEKIDGGRDPQRAELRVKYERILGPGDYVFWLDPPHDIHSQLAIDGTTWELVLFGKNPLRTARQYFDVESGRVTTRNAR